MKPFISSRFVPALILIAVSTAFTTPALSQVSFSIGPQISTLGLGVSGEIRLMRIVGISAEHNFTPISTISRSGFNSTFSVEPELGGSMVMIMLHPTGGKFALGAGIMAGGLTAEGIMALDPNAGAEISLGDGSYPASQIGALVGSLEYGKTQPAFLLGWAGRGFNFLIGAAIATPTATIEATGALKNNPTFTADLDREVSDLEDNLKLVPVYPYIRLGWHLGF